MRDCADAHEGGQVHAHAYVAYVGFYIILMTHLTLYHFDDTHMMIRCDWADAQEGGKVDVLSFWVSYVALFIFGNASYLASS